MVKQKQVFPIWKYLLLNIYTYAREDYLLSDRLSLLFILISPWHIV